MGMLLSDANQVVEDAGRLHGRGRAGERVGTIRRDRICHDAARNRVANGGHCGVRAALDVMLTDVTLPLNVPPTAPLLTITLPLTLAEPACAPSAAPS